MFFQSAVEFSLHIEEMVIKTSMTHMECVLKYCKDNFIDPEDTKTMLSSTLKGKIVEDMKNDGMIRKNVTLDALL